MILDSDLVDDFSKYFNSKFSTLDFLNGTNKLVAFLNEGLNSNQVFTIKLPCGNIYIQNQLLKFNYLRLLSLVIDNIKIAPESIEVYTNVMDHNLVEAYSAYLSFAKKRISFEIDQTNHYLIIKSPELLIDLMINPISQIHTEILVQLEYFNKFLNINGLHSSMNLFTENLYINSKESSPYSYFILAFLAENFNIKLKVS